MKPVKDIAGAELSIGDWIACAFSAGSHGATLRIGQIVGFPIFAESVQMIEVEWRQYKRYGPKVSTIRAEVVKFAKIGAPE